MSSCLRCKSLANFEVPLHFCSFACTAEHLGVELSDLVLIDGEKRKKEEKQDKRKEQTLDLKLKILDLSDRRLVRLQLQYADLQNLLGRDIVFNQLVMRYFESEFLNLTIAKPNGPISTQWSTSRQIPSTAETFAKKEYSVGRVTMLPGGWSRITIHFFDENSSKYTVEGLDTFEFKPKKRFFAVEFTGILSFYAHAYVLIVDTQFKEMIMIEPVSAKDPRMTYRKMMAKAVEETFKQIDAFKDCQFFDIQDLLEDTTGPQGVRVTPNKPRIETGVVDGYCASASFVWLESLCRNTVDGIRLSEQVNRITNKLNKIVASWPTLGFREQTNTLFKVVIPERSGFDDYDTHLASYYSWLVDIVFSILITHGLDKEEAIKWNREREEKEIQEWLPEFLADTSRRTRTELAAIKYILS